MQYLKDSREEMKRKATNRNGSRDRKRKGQGGIRIEKSPQSRAEQIWVV